MTWKVAEAKNKFSEVLDRADTDPQVVRRRDRGYVVLSEEKYRELTGEKPSLIDYLMNGPSLEGVDLTRDRSPMREVDF